ncbi:MAG: GNAT family N-acetyltransferase [Pseudomonadota bacterium]
MRFDVRRAGAADAALLSLIGQATFLETYFPLIPGPALSAHCQIAHSVAAYDRQLASADRRAAAWLLEHGDTRAPVGYALVCPPDLPACAGKWDVELQRIYCFSSLHRQGLGEALLAAALQHARNVGAPRLWLGVYQGNHRALAFYKKHGFESAGVRTFDVGGVSYDDFVLCKAL